MLREFGKLIIRFRHPKHQSLSFASSHVIGNDARFPRTAAQSLRLVEETLGGAT